jgi:vacuolar-type H+-ATPase subunit I/STV1
VSKETRFLSRLLGLYCLIIALAMLAQRQTTVLTVAALLHDRPLMYVLGVLCLFAGIAMVLVHNVWSGGAAAVIVTLIAWLTLLKGVAFIALQPAQTAELYIAQLRFESLYPLYAIVTLLLGAYLCYAGFSGARRPAL